MEKIMEQLKGKNVEVRVDVSEVSNVEVATEVSKEEVHRFFEVRPEAQKKIEYILQHEKIKEAVEQAAQKTVEVFWDKDKEEVEKALKEDIELSLKINALRKIIKKCITNMDFNLENEEIEIAVSDDAINDIVEDIRIQMDMVIRAKDFLGMLVDCL